MNEKAYKTIFKNLSEVQAFVGKEVGISPWLTIEQASVNSFATLTGDEQWIHTDPDKSAQYSPYGTTIAHGFYVLSLASRFLKQCMSVESVTRGINYGLDRVRFINAVPVGGKLRTRISILEYEAIEGGAKYKMSVVFELEGLEKPACIAEWIGMGFEN